VNDGYLDAESVITYLVNRNFIKENRRWKQEGLRVTKYTASFSRVSLSPNSISYEITVVEGVHYILKSTLIMHRDMFSWNIDNILK